MDVVTRRKIMAQLNKITFDNLDRVGDEIFLNLVNLKNAAEVESFVTILLGKVLHCGS